MTILRFVTRLMYFHWPMHDLRIPINNYPVHESIFYWYWCGNIHFQSYHTIYISDQNSITYLLIFKCDTFNILFSVSYFKIFVNFLMHLFLNNPNEVCVIVVLQKFPKFFEMRKIERRERCSFGQFTVNSLLGSTEYILLTSKFSFRGNLVSFIYVHVHMFWWFEQ